MGIKHYFLAFLVFVAASSAGAKGARSTSQLYELVKNSVTTIKAGGVFGGSTGAGVLVHKDGFVVTAAHVVENARSIQVEFVFGQKVNASIVTLSRTEDVALLKLESVPKQARPAPLANSDLVKVGDPIISVGAPLGLKNTLTKGIISAVRYDYGGDLSFLPKHVLQTDAAINPGNSGGAVFNQNGHVIGIASFIVHKGGGSVGLGFAVPSNTVRRRLFDNAIPYIGLSLRRIPRRVAEVLHWPESDLLLVEKVLPGSAAAKAGMRGGHIQTDMSGVKLLLGGDLILKVGNLDSKDGKKVHAYLKGLKQGDELEYRVVRRGKPLDVKIKIPKLIYPPKLGPLRKTSSKGKRKK